jgi:hypothetical protein
MIRHNRALVALIVGAVLLAGGFAFAGQAKTAPPPPAQQAAPPAPPAAPAKWLPPVKGPADIQVLPTVTKVDFKTNTVVTTITVKNVSNGPIAGLQCEEYWYDRSGNMVPGGDRFRSKKLVQPGEVITITLTTQRDPNMARPQYQFRHVNGEIRAKQVKKF